MRSWRHQDGVDVVVEEEAMVNFCSFCSTDVEGEKTWEIGSLECQESYIRQRGDHGFACSGKLFQVVLDFMLTDRTREEEWVTYIRS